MKCAVSVHTYLSHLENVIHYVFLQKLIMVFVEVNSQMMGGGGGGWGGYLISTGPTILIHTLRRPSWFSSIFFQPAHLCIERSSCMECISVNSSSTADVQEFLVDLNNMNNVLVNCDYQEVLLVWALHHISNSQEINNWSSLVYNTFFRYYMYIWNKYIK